MNAIEARTKSLENRKRIEQKEREEREKLAAAEQAEFEIKKENIWKSALKNIEAAVEKGSSGVILHYEHYYANYILEKLKDLGYRIDEVKYDSYPASPRDPDSGEGGYEAGTSVTITVAII